MRLLAYDLSMDGCMIDTGGERLPPMNSEVSLVLAEGIEVSGTIMWTRGRFGGVKFAERLEYKVVEKLGFKPEFDLNRHFKDRFGRLLALPYGRSNR